MNIIKKGIILLVIFSMLITSFATIGFASEVDAVQINDYDRAVEVLSALGIMEGKENGDFAAEDFLTRAEMSTVAIRLLGMEDAKRDSDASRYTDVADGHWAKGYINMATDFKLVEGNGDGTFEPEAELTAEQAIKILVSVLGYQPKAMDKGGYPAGYLYVANQMDLTKGADFSNGYSNPISRGTLAILVYNSLDKEIMEKMRYGDEGFFAVNEATDILGAYHNMRSLRGVIEATDVNSLDAEGLEKGNAVIDGVSYKTDLDMTEYIGYSVDFYCTIAEGNSLGEIIAFFPVEEQTERTTIEFDDITSIVVNDDFGIDAKYFRPEGGREKKISLDRPVIIYNGKTEVFATAMDAQNFIDQHMTQGTFTFQKKVKADGTNILFMDSYKAYFVVNNDAYARKIVYDIYTRYGVERGELDLSTEAEPERQVLFYESATKEPILMGDIANFDVIEVYESTDGKLCKVYRVKNKVTGTVERKEVMDNSTKPNYDFEPFKTISPSGFENFETTYHSFLTKKTEDGREYQLNMDNGAWWNYRLGEKSGLYPTYRLEIPFPNITTNLPEFANGTIAWLDRGISISDVRGEAFWSSEAAAIKVINMYAEEDFELGDQVRLTAWVYANKMGRLTDRTSKATETEGRKGSNWVDDTTATTVKTRMALRQVRDNSLGLKEYSPTDAEIVNVDIELDKWQPITLTYEITEDNLGVSSVFIDNYGITFGETYPLNLFFAGMEIEKLNGAGYNAPIDETDYELYIDGVGYKATEQVYTSLIDMSEEVTLYLDSNNRVAGYAKERAHSNYGLLMDVAVVEDTFDKSYLRLKILDSEGKLRTYDTLSEIKAWNGTEVTKLDPRTLITNERIDIMTSHYLWSTDNSYMFSGVNRTYLDDDTKSDFACRKMIYYETNSEDKISKILVPSMPEDKNETKIVMVQDFNKAAWEQHSAGNSENFWFYAGSRVISYAYAWDYKGQYRDSMTHRISNTALVYEAFALNYDINDYSLIPAGVTALAGESVYKQMRWDGVQLYKYPGSDTIDFMIILPTRNEEPETMVVDQLLEREDGLSLKGYVDGKEVIYPIRENTRLLERIPATADEADAEIVTKDMLPQLAAEERPIFFVTPESNFGGGQETPFIEAGSLHKGDIVKTVVRDGEIAWLEVARCASIGVVCDYNTTFAGSNMSYTLFSNSSCLRGEVVDVEKAANTVAIKGYYWYFNNNARNAAGRSKEETDKVHELTAWLHVTNSKVFTVYDAETGDIYEGSLMDIEVGDYIYSYGYAHSPRCVILIKNED